MTWQEHVNDDLKLIAHAYINGSEQERVLHSVCADIGLILRNILQCKNRQKDFKI